MAENLMDKKTEEDKTSLKYDIVIDLKNSFNAVPYSSDEEDSHKTNIIQIEEFERVKSIISDRIERIDKKECSIKFEEKRYNDTISVLGTRGSGKTSFLLSIKEYYRKHEEIGIAVLPLIDPTIIEEKGHIFLTILSLIKEEVENKLGKDDCCPKNENYILKKEWRTKLKKLAEGIPTLDKVGKGFEDWSDPEMIMDKGLRGVRAAKNLEKDFHDVVRLGLRILHKKAFLLTLDDIDINFRRGWDVLETVRKYLTTPYIITMISGDLRLYSKAIRKQQWDNFGKALLINEGDKLGRLKEYDGLVTEMESQYMQKILQPQYRFHLLLLRDILNMGKYNIMIRKFIEGDDDKLILKTQDIVDEYNEILGNIGISSNIEKVTYRSYLLALPLRTQVEYMMTSCSNMYAQVDPFLSEVYNKKVNVDLLNTSPQYTTIEILKFLLKEHLLYESYQLQPIATDNSLNAVIYFFNIVFGNQYRQYPSLIFDYFIRIGYTRNLLQLMPYQDIQNKEDIFRKNNIEEMCKFSNMMQTTSLYHISCHIASYVRASLNAKNYYNKLPGCGTLILRALDVTRQKANGGIDGIKASLVKRIFAFLPVSIAQSNSKASGMVVYSIYTLISAVGNLLCKYNSQLSDIENIKSIKDELLNLSQIRSFPMPNFEKGTTGGSIQLVLDSNEHSEEDPSGDESIEDKSTKDKSIEDNKELDTICGLILKWIQEFFNLTTLKISSQFLGKISTRLFFALQTIEEKNQKYTFRDAMNYRIIVLMNTILLEDVREHNLMDVLKLSNDNPVGNNKLFVDNLNKIIDNQHLKKYENEKIDMNQLAFSMWMLSCPLLTAYLNLKTGVTGATGADDSTHKKMSLGELIDLFLNKKNNQDFNIYEELMGVKLAGEELEDWNYYVEKIRYIYDTPTKLKNIKRTELYKRLGVDKNKDKEELVRSILNVHDKATEWIYKSENSDDSVVQDSQKQEATHGTESSNTTTNAVNNEDENNSTLTNTQSLDSQVTNTENNASTSSTDSNENENGSSNPNPQSLGSQTTSTENNESSTNDVNDGKSN